MTFRVIQWATGGVGRAAIEGIVNHPELKMWVSYAAAGIRTYTDLPLIRPYYTAEDSQ